MNKLDINESNFTDFGEMNLVLQIMGKNKVGRSVSTDTYQPRKNRVWSDQQIVDDELITNVKDTIERLKIGQILLQQWLEGKIDAVYYYDLDQIKEDETTNPS